MLVGQVKLKYFSITKIYHGLERNGPDWFIYFPSPRHVAPLAAIVGLVLFLG